MKIFRSYSSLETKKFGADLAKKFVQVKHGVSDRGALILALKGDLGAGKTTFTQGFLRGLGVRKRVSSPTFVLMKRFSLRSGVFKNVYHLDCYRIKKATELESLGLKEILEDSKNVVLIEWPERLGRVLPKQRIDIIFRHHSREVERLIYCEGSVL